MVVSNHNVIYNAIGNNTTMYHPSISENKKPNSYPENERDIELEKKTMMLSILSLVTRFSLKTLKYWVRLQRGQSYLMWRRGLFSLGWLRF